MAHQQWDIKQLVDKKLTNFYIWYKVQWKNTLINKNEVAEYRTLYSDDIKQILNLKTKSWIIWNDTWMKETVLRENAEEAVLAYELLRLFT